jgi:hypothetical protein
MFYHRPMLPRLLRPQQHPNSCLLLCLHQRPLLHHPPRHKPYHHRCFLSKLQRLRPLEWMYVWTRRLWRLCFPGLYLPGALLYPSPKLQPIPDLLRLQSTSRRRQSHQHPCSNRHPHPQSLLAQTERHLLPRSIIHFRGLRSCLTPFVSSCLRGEKRINHQDTKAQSFSSPLVHWRSSGRLESLPYVHGLPSIVLCRLRSAV